MARISPKAIPDYYEVITEPMYLQLIRKNAKEQKYKSLRQFLSDFELMRDNCIKYNEGRDTWLLIPRAITLVNFAEDEIKKVASCFLVKFSDFFLAGDGVTRVGEFAEIDKKI
jgi:hypothetical protein